MDLKDLVNYLMAVGNKDYTGVHKCPEELLHEVNKRLFRSYTQIRLLFSLLGWYFSKNKINLQPNTWVLEIGIVVSSLVTKVVWTCTSWNEMYLMVQISRQFSSMNGRHSDEQQAQKLPQKKTTLERLL